MMLHDAIRNANSQYTVYFLLTAYLDTLQFGRKLPEHLTVLPIVDLRDLESRFEKLVAEFECELRVPVCQLLNENADQSPVGTSLGDSNRVPQADAA
jgi:hypothetical protein